MNPAALLALLFIFNISGASAETYSLEKLATALQEQSLRTLEEAISLLPRDFRRNPVLMRSSRSLQNSGDRTPRAILSNEDGSFVLTFNDFGTTFEMVQFHRDTKRFEFAEIEFYPDRAPELRRDLSKCSGCHGVPGDLHPVFESFPKWPGAYGGDGERIDAMEGAALRSFLDSAKSHPRYGKLIDLESTHGKTDASGLLAGRPNSSFLRKIMRLNYERIAEHARLDPGYPRYRLSILASIYCVKRAGFSREYFPEIGNAPPELFGIEEGADPYKSDSIGFYWQFFKRNVSTSSWTLSFGDAFNQEAAVLPAPDSVYGTATQELARALVLMDPSLAEYVGMDGRKTPDCRSLLPK